MTTIKTQRVAGMEATKRWEGIKGRPRSIKWWKALKGDEEEPPHGPSTRTFPPPFNASGKLPTPLIALQCFWIDLYFFLCPLTLFCRPLAPLNWHLKTPHCPLTPLYSPSPPSYPMAIYSAFPSPFTASPSPFNAFSSPFNASAVPLASLHHPLMHLHQPLTLFIHPLMPPRRALLSLRHHSMPLS